MAESYDELRSLSLDELKRRYDSLAPSTIVGLSSLREEIGRRETDDQNQRMVAYTKQMRDLTVAIAVMTIVNLIVAGAALYIALA